MYYLENIGDSNMFPIPLMKYIFSCFEYLFDCRQLIDKLDKLYIDKLDMGKLNMDKLDIGKLV